MFTNLNTTPSSANAGSHLDAEPLVYQPFEKIPFAVQTAVLKELPAASAVVVDAYERCIKDNIATLDELKHCRSAFDVARAELRFLMKATEETLVVSHQVAGISLRIAAAPWAPHYVRDIRS